MWLYLDLLNGHQGLLWNCPACPLFDRVQTYVMYYLWDNDCLLPEDQNGRRRTGPSNPSATTIIWEIKKKTIKKNQKKKNPPESQRGDGTCPRSLLVSEEEWPTSFALAVPLTLGKSRFNNFKGWYLPRTASPAPKQGNAEQSFKLDRVPWAPALPHNPDLFNPLFHKHWVTGI